MPGRTKRPWRARPRRRRPRSAAARVRLARADDHVLHALHHPREVDLRLDRVHAEPIGGSHRVRELGRGDQALGRHATAEQAVAARLLRPPRRAATRPPRLAQIRAAISPAAPRRERRGHSGSLADRRRVRSVAESSCWPEPTIGSCALERPALAAAVGWRRCNATIVCSTSGPARAVCCASSLGATLARPRSWGSIARRRCWRSSPRGCRPGGACYRATRASCPSPTRASTSSPRPICCISCDHTTARRS